MTFEMTPIGLVHAAQRYRYEMPRQAAFAENIAEIELYPGRGFDQALRDLAGVERIWVLFCFHLNETWRPLVTPPVAPPGRKIGLFATRSPHRPNRIGMSAVELLGVDGLRLRIRNSDLLDLTPVLDIKPYIAAADAFPDARVQWLEEAEQERYSLMFTPRFLEQSAWLRENTGLDPENFTSIQLANAPFDASRKRLTQHEDGRWSIGCRTWRFFFTPLEGKILRLQEITSNYAETELVCGTPDPYRDKDFHRAFLALFPAD